MKKLLGLSGLVCLGMMALPGAAWADSGGVNTGDTAYVLFCAALVMLMTPGLALFYGGMVRKKNVLSTFMQSMVVLCLVSVQWVLFGYSLAFGPDVKGLIGSLHWFGLNGVGLTPYAPYGATIPHLAFMIFQLMFAIITTALISGSVAERMRFPAFVLFSLLWCTLVYAPLAHWVWAAGGWLRKLGVLDFAGGTAVEIASGVSGLVAALVIGRRKGYNTEPMLPHHLPMTVLGASLLWFGWFGFNSGGALGANGLAASAFVVTNTAGAAAALAWIAIEWKHNGKPTMLGLVSGAVAGMVAITPAAGFVTAPASLVIGLVAGGICYLFVSVLKNKFGYDDSLDVFGVHGIGGTWGTLATGIFATKAVNAAGANGLLYGNPKQVVIQAIAILVAWVFTGAATLIIIKAVGLLTPVRASKEEEVLGLDINYHGEEAYPGFLTGGIKDLPYGRPQIDDSTMNGQPARKAVGA